MLIALAAVVILAVAVAALAIWYRSASAPVIEGELAVPGLLEPVRILRDGEGVPHIFAENDRDATFALGVVHAQDRLWQMDTFRRIGAGRMSELAGPATRSIDVFMRTMGFADRALRDYEALPEDIRAAVQAYADGVNHVIDTLPVRPAEYLVLGVEPERWKPEDAILVSKLMSVRLATNFRHEKLYALLAAHLGPGRLGTLFERWPEADEQAFLDVWSRKTASMSRDILETLGAVDSASNAWAAAPGRTTTGGALMANDPHLRLDAPILWYLARIVVSDYDLAGATIPGLPFHLLGRNGHIAWGFTSVGADTQDLFIERIDDTAPSRYLTPRGSEPFETRSFEIGVRGEKPQKVSVRVTRHGPVLSDIDPDLAGQVAPGHVIALSYATTQFPDAGLAAAYGLSRARDWNAARQATKDVISPVFNLIVADSEGTVAHRVVGKIPVRREGSGVLPMPGWTGQYDWLGYLSFEQMPETVKTGDGVVVNANNRLDLPEDSPPLTHYWDDSLRFGRASALLDRTGRHSLESFAAIQNDIHASDAEILLPHLLARTKTTDDRLNGALDILIRWDRKMSDGEAAPLIYAAWVRQIGRKLFSDELAGRGDVFERWRVPLIERLLREESEWCDDISTDDRREDCASVMVDALEQALTDLSNTYGDDPLDWSWGAAHRATLNSPVFMRVPGLSSWADLARATDGGQYTLKRGAGTIGNEAPVFPHNHGAGYRGLYDLAAPENSRFMIATGQSGNPLSKWWGSFVERWAAGQSITLTGTPDTLLSDGARELMLRPESN